jgi:[ribosomal protein S5]-alanine N-acetyltransferase
MRAANKRAEELARRLGMQWVGETNKYYGPRPQEFRLQPPDLIAANDR